MVTSSAGAGDVEDTRGVVAGDGQLRAPGPVDGEVLVDLERAGEHDRARETRSEGDGAAPAAIAERSDPVPLSARVVTVSAEAAAGARSAARTAEAARAFPGSLMF